MSGFATGSDYRCRLTCSAFGSFCSHGDHPGSVPNHMRHRVDSANLWLNLPLVSLDRENMSLPDEAPTSRLHCMLGVFRCRVLSR